MGSFAACTCGGGSISRRGRSDDYNNLVRQVVPGHRLRLRAVDALSSAKTGSVNRAIAHVDGAATVLVLQESAPDGLIIEGRWDDRQ